MTEPTLEEMLHSLDAGATSAVDLVGDALARLEKLTPDIGAVSALDAGVSLAEARASDQRRRRGEAGRLEGVPFAVKDWIDVDGWPVAGSGAEFAERRAPADAVCVDRLRRAGAIVVAVTSALADSPAHGRTRNPVDPSRAPGGSSSGAAAVVAAGAVPFAVGSDSGGSIRLPAAWCGVCGFKPTFGLVPLRGHFPRLGTLSDGRTVIGPIARTVRDLVVPSAVMSGPDPLEPTMPPVGLGDPGEVALDGLAAGVIGDEAVVGAAVAALRSRGVAVREVPVDDPREEALDITLRYWGRRDLSGEQSEQLLWDWDRFRRRMAVRVQGLDVVVTPATPGPAPAWRESEPGDYIWQLPWSLTGSPAVVVPVAERDGLPMAAQIVAQPWRDDVALAAGIAVQEALRG